MSVLLSRFCNRATLAAWVWLALGVIGLLVIYLPGLGNGLVFDDARFTDGTIFSGYAGWPELKQRVLSYSSFVWVQALFGEGWWKQRLVNLLLHGGVVLMLYLFWIQLARQVRWPEAAAGQAGFDQSLQHGAALGALLYGFNPVAVYAVAYLIQRSILMATLFVLIGLYAFCRGLIEEKRGWLALAALCYPLAVLSKEHALLAPLLALALYVQLRRPAPRVLALLAAAVALLTVVALAFFWQRYAHLVGSVFDDLSRAFVEQLAAREPDFEKQVWPLSMLNQAALFFYYGLLWVLPNVSWMSIDIRLPFPVSFLSWPHLLGAVGFVAVLLSSIWLVLRRTGVPGLIGLCLLIPATLFMTEFATVWIQDPFALYRSYLWAIALPGVVLLLAAGARPRVLWSIGAVLLVIFVGLSFERVLSMKNELTVWSDAAAKLDRNPPFNTVGQWRAYFNRGNEHLRAGFAELAINDYQKMLALGEKQGRAHYGIALAQQRLGRHAEAVAAFDAAEAQGYHERESLRSLRGESLYASAQCTRATEEFARLLAEARDQDAALIYRLRYAESALACANLALASTEFDELLRILDSSELDRQSPLAGLHDGYRQRAHIGLGMIALANKNPDAALPHFEAAIRLGEHADAFYGRALVIGARGQLGQALADVERALRIDRNKPQYQKYRAYLIEQIRQLQGGRGPMQPGAAQ